MQRIVRWNVGSTSFKWELPGNEWSDLQSGHVGYFELNAVDLEKISPELRKAFTRDGKVGRIVDHTYSIEGGHRVFTFIVAFN